MSGIQLPNSFPISLLLPLATAVLAGAVIPFQAGANATLGRTLGHPLAATLVSLLVSLAALLPARRIVPGQHCLCPGCLAARQRGDQAPEPAED